MRHRVGSLEGQGTPISPHYKSTGIFGFFVGDLSAPPQPSFFLRHWLVSVAPMSLMSPAADPQTDGAQPTHSFVRTLFAFTPTFKPQISLIVLILQPCTLSRLLLSSLLPRPAHPLFFLFQFRTAVCILE